MLTRFGTTEQTPTRESQQTCDDIRRSQVDVQQTQTTLITATP